MAKIFGHRWVSSYGEMDDGSWLAGLHDVTVEQVKVGLERLRVSEEPWPPTLPQFRAMCLPPIVPPYHVPYKSQKLIAKEIDWEGQRAQLAKVRAVLNRHKANNDPEARAEREAIQNEEEMGQDLDHERQP
jgi:hypothetical protein